MSHVSIVLTVVADDQPGIVEDLSDALRDALASGRPACVNVEIEGLPAPALP